MNNAVGQSWAKDKKMYQDTLDNLNSCGGLGRGGKHKKILNGRRTDKRTDRPTERGLEEMQKIKD